MYEKEAALFLSYTEGFLVKLSRTLQYLKEGVVTKGGGCNFGLLNALQV